MLLRHINRLLLLLFLIGSASSQDIAGPVLSPINYGLIGQVVNSTGTGMQGVTVWIIGISGGTEMNNVVLNTTTNVTGYYAFDVTPGDYSIMAELPGYSFTSSSASVLAGNISIAQLITGYVAGIEPPAQAFVQPPAQPVVQLQPQTQPFVQPQVQPTAQPQAQSTLQAPIASQLYTGYLGGGTGLLQGRIVDQSGAPIPMASITVDGIRTAATSDEQGYYRITLNSGLHRVDAAKTGFGIPPRVILVLAGQTSTLDLIGKRAVALGAGR